MPRRPQGRGLPLTHPALKPCLLQALGLVGVGAGRLYSPGRGAGGRGMWELPLGAGIGGLPTQRHPEVGWLLPFHHHLLLGAGDGVSNHLGHLPLISATTLEKGASVRLREPISSANRPPPLHHIHWPRAPFTGSGPPAHGICRGSSPNLASVPDTPKDGPGDKSLLARLDKACNGLRVPMTERDGEVATGTGRERESPRHKDRSAQVSRGGPRQRQ